VDDDSSVAAEFECDALLARFALQLPPDAAAPGEGQQLDPIVGHNALGIRVAEREDVQRSCRPSRLRNQASQAQRAERGLRRRFVDNRAARGNRRRPLVRDEIHREIERSNRRDRPQRKTPQDRRPADGRGLQVERQPAPFDPASFLARDRECENRPIDFRPRRFDRFARLERHCAGKVLAVFGEPCGDFSQNPLPLVAGHAPGLRESANCGANRRFDVLHPRAKDGANHAPIVRGVHFHRLAFGQPPTIH